MSASPPTNPFEALAQQQMTATSKRRLAAADRRAARSVVLSERDAPMKGTAMEEARDERAAQMAAYNRAKAIERDSLVNGPHGQQAAPLLAMLRSLTIDGAGALVSAVLSAGWIKTADVGTKQVLLSLIGRSIMRVRVQAGLSPFDDAIFDEAPTAFQIIRRDMMGV